MSPVPAACEGQSARGARGYSTSGPANVAGAGAAAKAAGAGVAKEGAPAGVPSGVGRARSQQLLQRRSGAPLR